MLENFLKAYLEDYKKFMIIPLLMLLFFSGVILYTKFTAGEFFFKDISLKGGTSINFYPDARIPGVDEWIKNTWGSDSQVVVISDTFGSFKGYDFRTSRELNISEVKTQLSLLTGRNITESDFSMGIQSATIASSFYNEFLVIILISFTLMGLVAIYYFKSPITAFTTAFCTLTNIIVVIGVLDLLGASLSVAGIGAILMLLGLSTDTDILLASTILNKDRNEMLTKLKRIFYTEVTICFAAITNAFVIFTFSNIEVIRSISLILLIGTTADLFSTLFLSAGLMRIYTEKKRGSK